MRSFASPVNVAVRGFALPRFIRRAFLPFSWTFLLIAGLGQPLFGATFIVNNTNDSGAGSLRQAITDANHGDVIAFSITGTITLTSGQLTLAKDLEINGPGANQLVISGNKAGRVFYVQTGAKVIINDIAISDGISNLGGGIYNSPGAQLTLNKCLISRNQATVADGGLSNEGTMTINSSTISANNSKAGGGVGNNGTLIISSCTISGNSASLNGGGLDNNGGGIATLGNSTITNNIATKNGGGINNAGAINIKSTIVARNTAVTGNDIKGAVNLQGYNLISNTTAAVLANIAETDIFNVDARLSELSYHGGTTPTHVLFPDSPAIDHGASQNATDQRGGIRPQDLGNVQNASDGDGSDIGAVEGVIQDYGMSGQKAGSILVFPYYISKAQTRWDTRITISNISGTTAIPANAVTLHYFFIEGNSCNYYDFFGCLNANTSTYFKMSEIDPEVTGWLFVVAVDRFGIPTVNNIVIGNAFFDAGEYGGNYSAEVLSANSSAITTMSDNKATLYFNGVGYDPVPSQVASELLSPLEVTGQRLITVGLSGDLTANQLAGAAQISTGQIYAGNGQASEVFSNFLVGKCFASGTFSTNNPRMARSLGALIPVGQIGIAKISVGAAAGLFMTPRSSKWFGTRPLQKVNTTATTMVIPISVPGC